MYGCESTAKDQRSVWSKKHTSPTAKPAATAVTAAFVVLFVHNSPTNIVAPSARISRLSTEPLQGR